MNVADFAAADSPTAGIQDAIESLPASGGLVTIPAGEYLRRAGTCAFEPAQGVAVISYFAFPVTQETEIRLKLILKNELGDHPRRSAMEKDVPCNKRPTSPLSVRTTAFGTTGRCHPGSGVIGVS